MLQFGQMAETASMSRLVSAPQPSHSPPAKVPPLEGLRRFRRPGQSSRLSFRRPGGRMSCGRPAGPIRPPSRRRHRRPPPCPPCRRSPIRRSGRRPAAGRRACRRLGSAAGHDRGACPAGRTGLNGPAAPRPRPPRSSPPRACGARDGRDRVDIALRARVIEGSSGARKRPRSCRRTDRLFDYLACALQACDRLDRAFPRG